MSFPSKQKEYVKEYNKQYKQDHRELMAIYRKEYRHKNGINKRFNDVDNIPIKFKRKASKAKSKYSGNITGKIIQMFYEDNIKKYGTLTCYLCLTAIEFGEDTLDHKVSASRGGTNEYENLEIAHSICNTKKSSKTVEEYRKVKLKCQTK